MFTSNGYDLVSWKKDAPERIPVQDLVARPAVTQLVFCIFRNSGFRVLHDVAVFPGDMFRLPSLMNVLNMPPV